MVTSFIGAQLGRAIAEERDFQISTLLCVAPGKCFCGLPYKRRGWLLKHMKKTGHWRRPNATTEA